MLMVVDIGNTETVIGIFENHGLKSTLRLSSKTSHTADESWILIQTWLQTHGMKSAKIEGVVISSVVPSLTIIYENIVKINLQIEPLIINADIDTGLKIRYDSPQSVGADRICNAVAGLELYGSPLIVVDFGTATTFDVVSEGEYLGGAIALGLMSASHELHRLAAKLPRVGLTFPNAVVGKSTETSIQSGLMWGTVVLIDGMIDKIIHEMQWRDVNVIATGGAATHIAEKTIRIQKVEPNLTLHGMRIIFQRLQKN